MDQQKLDRVLKICINNQQSNLYSGLFIRPENLEFVKEKLNKKYKLVECSEYTNLTSEFSEKDEEIFVLNNIQNLRSLDYLILTLGPYQEKLFIFCGTYDIKKVSVPVVNRCMIIP